MTMTEIPDAPGPWNPGLQSTLPREFLPLSTLFRTENTLTGLAEARDMADFSGLPLEEVSTLRPERLVLHELLIRITADLSVPDGTKYADLGINFRTMTRTLMDRHLLPHMPEIVAAFEDLRKTATAIVDAEAVAVLPPPTPPRVAAAPPPPAPRGLAKWFGGGKAAAPVAVAVESREEREQRVLAAWARKVATTADPLEKIVYESLARVARAIHRRQGRIVGSKELIRSLVMTTVSNTYGSEIIGRLIEPYFLAGVAAEGYRLLPAQSHPVVMNVKGASASGKSTMRPLQRDLARTLGVKWDEFALISPDIWRKFLLDYDALGAARRYAGTLTGHELAMIDKKLDRYMAAKGERGTMSHLLIDRFRFDSFASDPDKEDGSRLLTRFGDIVYMFFMITPPEATVERAWKRGEQFGRYKAVDDLLDHNVEAYNGMPRLFFTWVLRSEKEVHCEFLDNSVAEGTVPRTVAFGWNGQLNILDVRSMLNVDRFAKLNINARGPDEVYVGSEALSAENNTQFLRQCARSIPVVNFADYRTGRIYARLDAGELVWWDSELLRAAMADADVNAGLLAVAPQIARGLEARQPEPKFLTREGAHTLGRWGATA